MRLNRFQTLLDARGPGMDRWPADDRAAAQALLDRSAAARQILGDAVELDRVLSGMTAGPAGQLLRAAILDIPDKRGRSAAPPVAGKAIGGWPSRLNGAALGWTAIAASAAIGFAVGLWWPSEPPIWQSEDLVALVYGMPDLDPELDEVLR